MNGLPSTTRRLAAAALALAALVGCEPGSPSAPPAAGCAESGVQCQLPEGPLGVCERTSCGPGAEPPCFRCVSQH